MTLRELIRKGFFLDCGRADITIEGRYNGQTQSWNEFGIKNSPNGWYSMRGTFDVEDISVGKGVLPMILDLEIDTISVNKSFMIDSSFMDWELPKKYHARIIIYADLTMHAREFANAVKKKG